MSEQPTTAAGWALVEDEPRVVTGEHSMLKRVLAIEAETRQQDGSALRLALTEAIAYITAYDDAMGHSYCATQSGDYMDSCTCGYDAMMDRWRALAALPTSAPPAIAVAKDAVVALPPDDVPAA